MAERAGVPRTGRCRAQASLPLRGVACHVALAALLAAACLKRHDETQVDPDVARCTSCHGDALREGDHLLRAAPPQDLMQASTPGYPGVGAHEIHLNAGTTHGAFSCDVCHVVPEQVEAPGHIDDGPPGDVTFGALARQGERNPAYDPATRTCSDSYCHRAAWPVWTDPRASDAACGSCHGLPPPVPHPQSAACSVCHDRVIDAERRIIAPELHVNGNVEYTPGACQLCHGNADNPAPPLDTTGHADFSALGVGAHQAHLRGGAHGRALECGECHSVPREIAEPMHIDGLPAEVMFTGAALARGHVAQWNELEATCSGSWCHSPSDAAAHPLPVWNADRGLDCSACHGLPPALPHPQSTDCSACHGAVVAEDNRTIVDRSRHVDGVVDVVLSAACNSCHGGSNPAPPRDLAGNVATSFAGVGAHQAHLVASGRARPVPCSICHQVPVRLLEPEHLDSAPPAEVVFSGLAVAYGATPQYAAGACSGTPCHGAVFPDYASGGTNTTPLWTRVDGSQAACGTCHGLPPPPPHPNPTFPCHDCHFNLGPDDVTFVRPELHVDGKVTLQIQ